MKRLFLLSILILSTFTVWAERIDVATARRVAEAVATQNSEGLRSSSDELTLVYAAAPGKEQSLLRSGKVDGAADYFVFNVSEDKGFVIVAGDDCAFPVIGYSDKGNFHPDNLSDNLRSMLFFYQEQLSFASRQGIEPSKKVEDGWKRYLSGQSADVSRRVVLMETAQWGQDEPFNRFTPHVNGQRTQSGCVATAMAIVMNYHKYPSKAVNPPVLNHFMVEGKEKTQRIVYGAYDWDNMLLDYSSGSYNEAQGNAVAELMFHCGANVKMNYGRLESGAVVLKVAQALRHVFGYSKNLQYLTKKAYRWEEWKSLLRNELDARCPVVYDGRAKEGAGHAFVCDGYDSDGLFHINWGWNGLHDGFFVLSVLDYDGAGSGYGYDQSMIINIRRPESGEEKYYVRPYITKVDYKRSGSQFHAKFDIDYLALESHDFYMELGVVDQEGTVVQTPKSSSKVNLLYYEDGWMSYQQIERSFTCSSLSSGQRVALVCSDDGIHWEVMRTMEEVALGIDYSGVIQANPDVPQEPEQPVVAQIAWNSIDNTFLLGNGLTDDATDYYNVRDICFQLLHVKKNATLRYILHNYADWKDHLSVSYASEFRMFEAGESIKPSISEEGYFDIPVNLSELQHSYYIHFLNFLSDRRGELTYDIQIYTADSSTPVFECKDNKAIFTDKISGKVTPNPVVGNTNDTIPVSFILDSVLDSQLVGKEVCLYLNIWGFNPGEVALFYVEDGVKTKISLVKNRDYSFLLVPEDIVKVASLEPGKRYNFELVCTTVPRLDDPGNDPSIIFIVDKVENRYAPGVWCGSSLSIIEKEDVTGIGQLEADEAKVWSRDGVLHLQTVSPETAYIVTTDGRLCHIVQLKEGHQTLNLPRGFYIVRLGGKSYKIQNR